MTSKPKPVKMPLIGRVSSYAQDQGMNTNATRPVLPVTPTTSNTGRPSLLGGV